MKKYNHRSELSIPTNISLYAVFSGQVFLLQIIMSWMREQYLITFFSIMLYITTYLHWREPYIDGHIRTLDITMVLCSIISIFYYIYHYIPTKYHYNCLIHFGIVICWHIINEILYYCQVTKQLYLPIKDDSFDKYENSGYFDIKREIQRYFSLAYTFPNTDARDYAYRRSIITHCFFLHYWVTLSMLYYCFFYGGIIPKYNITV